MATSDVDADQRLMRSFAARDAGAADVLYRRFAGRIYGLGLVMLGNDAAAQDLTFDSSSPRQRREGSSRRGSC